MSDRKREREASREMKIFQVACSAALDTLIRISPCGAAYGELVCAQCLEEVEHLCRNTRVSTHTQKDDVL